MDERGLANEIADNYIRMSKNLDGITEMDKIVRAFLSYFTQQGPLYEKIICDPSLRYISDRINRKIAEANRSHVDIPGAPEIKLYHWKPARI